MNDNQPKSLVNARGAPARNIMPEASQPVDPHDVAAYIADFLQELIILTQAPGLDLVGYFLKMAYAECNARSGRASSLG